MNMNERFYLVAKTSKGKRVGIVGLFESAELAANHGMNSDEKSLPDYDVIRGDQLAEKLSGPELVSMHNLLVVGQDAIVARFATREVGAQRLVRAFDALDAEARGRLLPRIGRASPATTDVATVESAKTVAPAPVAGDNSPPNTDSNELWTDAPSEEKKVKTKKTRAAKADDTRKLILSARAKDKNAEKIWHEGSMRSKAFEWLEKNLTAGGMAYADAVRGIAKAQSIAQAKAKALIQKIIGVKMLEIKE